MRSVGALSSRRWRLCLVFRFLAERCTGTVPWTMVDALEEVKSVYEDVAHATDVFYDPLWPL